MRVLLIESGTPNTTLAVVIGSAGFNVEVVSPEDGLLTLLTSSDCAAVVVGVPSIVSDACDVVRRLRASGLDTPILMVSDSDQCSARVLGLRMGADDYVSKPFDKDEILARFKAVIRRYRAGHQEAVLKVGPLHLKRDTREVAVGSNLVELTSREFEVLHLLMLRKGTLLTKAAMLTHLYQDTVPPDARIIDVFVCKLRKKLAEAGADNLVHTVWGEGYLVRDPSGGGLYRTSLPQGKLDAFEIAA